MSRNRRTFSPEFKAGDAPGRRRWSVGGNGSIYTALDTMCAAERLGLMPITTPAASPQSNGMLEVLVNTMKRDYVAGADRSSAARILAQIPAWIADYNAVAPHSALGTRLPVTPAVSQ
jgi:transposase InsO family protein